MNVASPMEASIMQADKYMQSNSFKEDSRMIGQNFKVSYETYEQLGMDEYSISASNYLQGYSCGKELQSSRHKVFSYQQRARLTGGKSKKDMCIYLSIGIFRWQGIAKATGTKSRENIRGYLWNPSVLQAIIQSEGLSGRKQLQEPSVRVSKNHLTRVEERSDSQSIDEE